MEKLLQNFGFDQTFFVAQIINFLILAFLFKRYLYKPILKVLKDREKKIADGLADAEKANLALAEADARKDEIIAAATSEGEKIIEETKRNAGELRDSLNAASKKEADRIVQDAKAAVQSEFDRAQHLAEETSLDLSKKILDRILSEIFTKEEKEKIIKRNIKVLEKHE